MHDEEVQGPKMSSILGADGKPLPLPTFKRPEYMLEFFAYETIGYGCDLAWPSQDDSGPRGEPGPVGGIDETVDS